MFLIPQGMLNGASVSVSQFLLGNLLPVTLGNIVGGAVLVRHCLISALARFAAPTRGEVSSMVAPHAATACRIHPALWNEGPLWDLF